MLDSYYCNDSENNPEYPNEENYIGSFSLTYFKLLKDVVEYANTKNIRMHFFEDFRLNSDEVIDVLSFTKKSLQNIKLEDAKREPYNRLASVFTSAQEKGMGIMFFCD